MPFKDYTLRETEIHQRMSRELKDDIADPEAVKRWKSHVPKRLRGETTTLVNQMRLRHYRCSYTELLSHYCPVEVCFFQARWLLKNLTDLVFASVIQARMEEEARSTNRRVEDRHTPSSHQ